MFFHIRTQSHAQSAIRWAQNVRHPINISTHALTTFAVNAVHQKHNPNNQKIHQVNPNSHLVQVRNHHNSPYNHTHYDDLVADLREKVDEICEIQSTLPLSSVTYEHLTQLNIESSGFLNLKHDYAIRAAETDLLGSRQHWSSEGLYHHLGVLQYLVPQTVKWTWIDAFFFRVAAMLPSSKPLVLNLEQEIKAPLSITIKPHNFKTIAGCIDCTAIMLTQPHCSILGYPEAEQYNKHNHIFFALQAQTEDMDISEHLSQAVGKLYACAKYFERDIVRGVLTDGHEWIFILLKKNADDDGATYMESHTIGRQYERQAFPKPSDMIDKDLCSMIPGIIVHWINHSNEDIRDDDWFTTSSISNQY